MDEYPKINTIWQRDLQGTIMVGAFASEEIEFLRDADLLWTEKVDGTNVRVGWDGVTRRIGGRTDGAQMPLKLVDAITDALPESLLKETFPDLDEGSEVTLYGEGYGAGVQRGGLYRHDLSLVLFDVKVGTWWLRRDDVVDVARKLGLDVVPLVTVGTLLDAARAVSEGIDSYWKPDGKVHKMEGLVGRPRVPLFDRRGDPILVKIKTKDYSRLRQVEAKRAVEADALRAAEALNASRDAEALEAAEAAESDAPRAEPV